MYALHLFIFVVPYKKMFLKKSTIIRLVFFEKFIKYPQFRLFLIQKYFSHSFWKNAQKLFKNNNKFGKIHDRCPDRTLKDTLYKIGNYIPNTF